MTGSLSLWGQAFPVRKLTHGIWVLLGPHLRAHLQSGLFSWHKGLWFPSSRDPSSSCIQPGTWPGTRPSRHTATHSSHRTRETLLRSVQDKRDLRKAGCHSWFMRTCRQRQEAGQASVHPENWGYSFSRLPPSLHTPED